MDLILLLLLGLSSAQCATVFLDSDQAHRILKSGPVLEEPNSSSNPGPGPDGVGAPILIRTKRFNSGWFEELQRGDLRRECVEELCSYEEAREVFEHTETTNEFWKTYRVQDSCSSGPCLNGGTCVDLGKDFICLCPQDWSGLTCDLDDNAALRRCLVSNGGCGHFCEETEVGPVCSCADGYELDQDQVSCRRTVPVACGMVPVLQGRTSPPVDPRGRIVGGSECPRGECPWTILLKNKGRIFCGGVFLSPDWVLTAAHCLEDVEPSHLQAVAGEHDVDVVEGFEQEVQVTNIFMHESYNPRTANNDIALLRLSTPLTVTSHAVPVCLPTRAHAHTQLLSVSSHTVSGWGRVHEAGPTSRVLKRLQVPLVRTQTCEEQSGLKLTENMLCGGYLSGQGDSCKGDSGGPLVTRFKETWFLTGIVSWGRGCARPGQYGVYTRLSQYLDWIRAKTESWADDTSQNMTHKRSQHPELNQTTELSQGLNETTAGFALNNTARSSPVSDLNHVQNQTKVNRD